VIWALWHHFVLYRDVEFVKPYYKSLIKKAAGFMVRYRESWNGLPGPSYDLWEERRGMSSFTVAAVFGGLAAASVFCTVFGEEERARVYRQAASDIRDATSRTLWRPELGRFVECFTEMTAESSKWTGRAIQASGAFCLCLYTVDDPRIESTMKALEERLWVSTENRRYGAIRERLLLSLRRPCAEIPGSFLPSGWRIIILKKAKWKRG